jgi:transposase
MASIAREVSGTGETPVAVGAGRRRFTVEYKSWVVQEAERLRGSGDVGGFLRREGIFSSQLTMWRKQYQAGVRQALSPARGPKVTPDDGGGELRRLQRENAKLREQLVRAELVIEIQKKLAALMDVDTTEPFGGPT